MISRHSSPGHLFILIPLSFNGIPAVLSPFYGSARNGFMPVRPKPGVGVSGLLQSTK